MKIQNRTALVNDLPEWIKTNIKMFMDDTKLWNTIRHELDSQEMQKDLNRLREWSNKWLLDFNIEKCKSYACWT